MCGKRLLLLISGMILAIQCLGATIAKDVFLEEFPTGLWTGFYRYVSCEDNLLYGEGSAHLTIDRVILDDNISRITIDGTLSLIGFPETDTAANYATGVKLDTSEIIKTTTAGVYDVYLNPMEGPSFTASYGYQPRANTLIAAITTCEGNPYKISLILHPPVK